MALTKVTGQVIKNTTDVTVGVLTVTNTLAVGGTVSIGGTLTYEDVTNIDSVGLITARSNILVGSGITLSPDGDVFAVGVSSLGTGSDGGVELFHNGVSRLTAASYGVAVNGDILLSDALVHIGDTNTKIRFPESDHISMETGGYERVRIKGNGNIGIGTNDPNNRFHVYGGQIKAQTSTDDTSTNVDLLRAQCGSTGNALFSVRAADAADNNSDWDIKTNADEELSFTIGAGTEKARITSSGNVGIGTSVPVSKLDVYDSGSLGIISRSAATQATDTNKALRVRNNNTTNRFSVSYKGFTEIRRGEIGTYLKVGGDDSGNGRALTFTSSDTASVGALHTLDAISGNGAIALATNGNERLRVDSGGLLVSTTGQANGIRLVDSSTSSGSPNLEIISKRQDSNVNTAFAANIFLGRNRTDQKIADNTFLGTINFGGNHTDGTEGNISYAAAITARASGDFNSKSDMPTDLVFTTSSSGTDRDGEAAGQSNVGTERVRIIQNGNVSIGSASDSGRLYVKSSGNGSGANAFDVENSDGDELLRIRNDGGFYTGIDAGSPYNFTTGSAANVHIQSSGRMRRSTSSVRYKKDIQDATWGLAEVLKLKPVTYKSNGTGENADDKTYGGFTAEDIHDLGLTEFVEYNESNQPDSLNYGNMVALMAKAIQEAVVKIEVLESEVAALKSS